MKQILQQILLTGILLGTWVPENAFGSEVFDQSHARYARVLSNVVNHGHVDYARLNPAPNELNGYLDELAAVKPDKFAQWTQEDRLALLLNLYNASTLRLIIDHYPLKSIRQIGTLPGAAWRQLIVRFAGQVMTLDHLENKIIRPNYREPRVHFALVCAAKGCPLLRSEPYQGKQLGRQLDDQSRQFLATAEKNRLDAETGTLWLSPIFKWYQDDFTANAGSLQEYVKPFLPEASRQALSRISKVKVAYTTYDWALND